jgi:hypothetical protein
MLKIIQAEFHFVLLIIISSPNNDVARNVYVRNLRDGARDGHSGHSGHNLKLRSPEPLPLRPHFP